MAHEKLYKIAQLLTESLSAIFGQSCARKIIYEQLYFGQQLSFEQLAFEQLFFGKRVGYAPDYFKKSSITNYRDAKLRFKAAPPATNFIKRASKNLIYTGKTKKKEVSQTALHHLRLVLSLIRAQTLHTLARSALHKERASAKEREKKPYRSTCVPSDFLVVVVSTKKIAHQRTEVSPSPSLIQESEYEPAAASLTSVVVACRPLRAPRKIRIARSTSPAGILLYPAQLSLGTIFLGWSII